MDLTQFGIPEGKCVDEVLIKELFDITLPPDKHNKRDGGCRCYWGCDIGMESTCLNGCVYCYATQSSEKLSENVKSHSVNSPSIHSWLEVNKPKSAHPCTGCGGCNASQLTSHLPWDFDAVLPKHVIEVGDVTPCAPEPWEVNGVPGGLGDEH